MKGNPVARAVGIYLEGEQPTPEERMRLEARAIGVLGKDKYTVKLVVGWDAYLRMRFVRLDAIPL